MGGILDSLPHDTEAQPWACTSSTGHDQRDAQGFWHARFWHLREGDEGEKPKYIGITSKLKGLLQTRAKWQAERAEAKPRWNCCQNSV